MPSRLSEAISSGEVWTTVSSLMPSDFDWRGWNAFFETARRELSGLAVLVYGLLACPPTAVFGVT
jgi:hypothetical protein